MKKATLIIVISLFVFSVNTRAQDLKTCETFIKGSTLTYDSIGPENGTEVGIRLYKNGKKVARINSKFQEFHLKNGILSKDEDGVCFMIYEKLRVGKPHKKLLIEEGGIQLFLKKYSKDADWDWWYIVQ